MTARDELAFELFVGDNANQPRESSAQDWIWFKVSGKQQGQVEHYKAMAEHALAVGYRKPRTISTADEIRNLPALTVVLHDDMATGGPLQAFVVPDDGTVMFRGCEEFHLMTFAGDYIDAKDMPLPLTVVYEVGA